MVASNVEKEGVGPTYNFACKAISKGDQYVRSGWEDANGASSVLFESGDDFGHEFVHGVEIERGGIPTATLTGSVGDA